MRDATGGNVVPVRRQDGCAGHARTSACHGRACPGHPAWAAFGRGHLSYYVYILAKPSGGVLYVGVTNNLVRRVHEHKAQQVDGFAKRYNMDRLVYFEAYDDVRHALQREKNMKHWPRAWKTRLIYEMNPAWRDLFDDIAR